MEEDWKKEEPSSEDRMEDMVRVEGTDRGEVETVESEEAVDQLKAGRERRNGREMRLRQRNEEMVEEEREVHRDSGIGLKREESTLLEVEKGSGGGIVVAQLKA